MPTTRRRRSRISLAPELTPEMIDLLLTGDSPADPFLRFTVDLLEGGDYLPRLFRENRAALEAEFHRRGLPGRPWILGPVDDADGA
jgi:hypothetical protein